MKIIEIEGKDFFLRDNLCTQSGDEILGNNSYGFYIKIPNICNANCLFCNKNEKEEYFDIKLMILSIKLVMEKVRISSFSITGGEPFLNPDLLMEIILAIHDTFPNPNISINTNGINIDKFYLFESHISKVHISRHHYNDKINKVLFRCNDVPDIEKIKEITTIRNNFIQLNCLLIKGAIDSKEAVEKYLEISDVYNTGFIGLMPINDFSKNNFVDKNLIFPILDKKHLNVGSYKNIQDEGLICSCMNCLYLNGEHFNQYYVRSVSCLNCKANNAFIFNGTYLCNHF